MKDIKKIHYYKESNPLNWRKSITIEFLNRNTVSERIQLNKDYELRVSL
mgnify:FL=1